jgi:hypothetical protein
MVKEATDHHRSLQKKHTTGKKVHRLAVVPQEAAGDAYGDQQQVFADHLQEKSHLCCASSDGATKKKNQTTKMAPTKATFVKMEADGNGLLRAASFCLFGSQWYYAEIGMALCDFILRCLLYDDSH